MKKTGSHSNGLKKNSVTLLGALAMSAAFMGPAVSIFFNMGPAAAAAGYAFPLSFLVSMVAVIFIANSVIQFARKVHGASFAFSYTSRGIGPKAGFMAGWILLFAYTMISPITFAGFGVMTTEFLERQFDIHISWIFFFVVIGLIVTGLSYLGISHSAKTTLIFLFLELIVIVILCGSVVMNGELTMQPLMLSNAENGISSIGLGMIFGILSFTGFEAAANLGEEAENANRTIPKAILIAVLMIGVLYVVSAYIVAVGFGNAGAIANNVSPFDTLAREFWGGGLAWIIAVSALNGVFANAVAGQASIVRNLFSLGREGILPRALGKTNASGVPVNAIAVNFFIAMVLGLAVGLWKDGWAVWTLLGGIMSLGLIIVYGMVTVALPFFYKKNYPAEYSPVKHLLFPIIGLCLLTLPLYSSLWPVPDFPYNLAPYILGVWIIAGAIYLNILNKKKSDLQDVFEDPYKDEVL